VKEMDYDMHNIFYDSVAILSIWLCNDVLSEPLTLKLVLCSCFVL